MNGVPMIAYLALGLFMFTTGVVGVIIRRNPIVIFMCIELMLNAELDLSCLRPISAYAESSH